MSRTLIESLVGAAVIAIAGGFVWHAQGVTKGGRSGDGYALSARFDKVDGVNPGTDVRLSGIKVGQVRSVELDPKTYLALVTVDIDRKIQLPVDSVIQVSSQGLLGGYYVSIAPGNADDMLKPGDRFRAAQGPVDLMDLIGKAIFSAAQSKSGDAAPTGGTRPAQ